MLFCLCHCLWLIACLRIPKIASLNMTPFKERSSNDKIIVESSQPRVMTLKNFRFKTSTFSNNFCREHSWLYRRLSRKREHTEKVEKLSSQRLSMTQSHSSYNWNFNFRELNFREVASVKKITMWPEFSATNLLRRNETIGWLQGLSKVGLPGRTRLVAENLVSRCLPKVQISHWILRNAMPCPSSCPQYSSASSLARTARV